MKELKNLQKLVDELNQSNSNLDKKTALSNHPECKKILFYIHNPMFKFNVKSTNVKKNKDLQKDIPLHTDIFSLLDDLKDRNITGHDALYAVNNFCSENNEYEDLIYKIIDKNLKCRIGVKLINQVFTDLISTFDVQLAYDYEKYKDKINFEKEDWFGSHKLDGIRLIIKKENDTVRFFSREGHEFFTLNNLKPSILKLSESDFVLDGEVCLVDEYGKENFTAIVSEIRKKDHTIESPILYLFDLLTIDEFNDAKSNNIFSDRIIKLLSLNLTNDIRVLDQIKIENQNKFDKLKGRCIKNGWEGLILRKDVKYEGKRSKNILKVKDFKDDEFKVIDVVNGNIRYIDYDENGKSFEVEEEMISSLVIEYKGNIVNVGSGLTIKERQDFYKTPEKIIDKIITVQYFEISEDKTGKASIRFPTLKTIHGDKRVI